MSDLWTISSRSSNTYNRTFQKGINSMLRRILQHSDIQQRNAWKMPVLLGLWKKPTVHVSFCWSTLPSPALAQFCWASWPSKPPTATRTKIRHRSIAMKPRTSCFPAPGCRDGTHLNPQNLHKSALYRWKLILSTCPAHLAFLSLCFY